MASLITSNALLRDPDHYVRKYTAPFEKLGMDPAQLTQGANLQSIYDLYGGFDRDYHRAVSNWEMTGLAKDMPPDFPDRLRGALAAGSIKTAVVDRSDPWGNDGRINSTLSSPISQPQRSTSAGAVLDPLTAGVAAADVAANVLPLTQSPAFGTGVDLDTPVPRVSAGADVNLGNVSGGGSGTSTAKGADTIARQAAKRGGGGRSVPGFFDNALGSPDLGIGAMAEKGLHRVGAYARANDMKNLGNALYRVGGAARVLAPAAAIGGAVLPAVFGAMDGYGQAGTGGALIQGSTGAAGALAGGAIGTAILGPGVGTVIGAGIGSMFGSGAGSGLTGLAQGAVEKAQMGDGGFMGRIGQAFDPFIDTAFEKEQKAVMQQMNSPAMQEIKAQERNRAEAARLQQQDDLLLQASLRPLF